MEILLIIGCVLVVAVWLLRKLRAREIAAFRNENSEIAEELAALRPQTSTTYSTSSGTTDVVHADDAQLLRRAEAFLKRTDVTDTVSQGKQGLADIPIDYSLKSRVIQSHLVVVAQRLERSLAGDTKVLFNQSLTGFMVPRPDLQGKSLSLLVCEATSYELIAGLEFRQDVSSAELQLLDKVFRLVDKPFFVLSNPAKLSEINDCVSLLNSQQSLPIDDSEGAKASNIAKSSGVLRPLPKPRESHKEQYQTKQCPKCTTGMRQKRTTIDSEKLRKVWVCNDYPSCKGMLVDDSI